jgi:NAD(P)-dependent dehydrogenase (short-subunit alcohol dehydrogenase family)
MVPWEGGPTTKKQSQNQHLKAEVCGTSSRSGSHLSAIRPLGRLGRVTDIAPLAAFLASEESGWITGEVIRAAGGFVVAT